MRDGQECCNTSTMHIREVGVIGAGERKVHFILHIWGDGRGGGVPYATGIMAWYVGARGYPAISIFGFLLYAVIVTTSVAIYVWPPRGKVKWSRRTCLVCTASCVARGFRALILRHSDRVSYAYRFICCLFVLCYRRQTGCGKTMSLKSITVC